MPPAAPAVLPSAHCSTGAAVAAPPAPRACCRAAAATAAALQPFLLQTRRCCHCAAPCPRVEKIEEEQRVREEAATASTSLDALQQRQIFDSRAAFRRLANELEEVRGERGFGR